jgi:hypothetical protein
MFSSDVDLLAFLVGYKGDVVYVKGGNDNPTHCGLKSYGCGSMEEGKWKLDGGTEIKIITSVDVSSVIDLSGIDFSSSFDNSEWILNIEEN